MLAFVLALLASVAVAYAAFMGWCAWRTARGRASGASEVHLNGAAANGTTGTHLNGVNGAHRNGARGLLPRIAVLVAARDEEATIGRCLDALLAQDYPADRIEIIVADDHSTDRTAEIIRRYAERTAPLVLSGDDEPDEAPEASGEIRVRYVRVPDPEGDLHGKALAIHTATEQTDAPALLVTDADCAPPPGWARGLVASLGGGVGLTGGLTIMEQRTSFHAAQSLDWAFLLGAASAMTEAGFPATAMGNNIAFTREAYDSVGGYPGIPFSVTEDYALFKAIADAGLWRVRFPIAPETLVRTLPARSFGHAYRQRRRWARGGMRAGPSLWAAYTLAHLAHLVPVVAFVLSPVVGAGILAVKIGADAMHLSAVLRRAGAGRLQAGPFFMFESFLFFYMCTLPLALVLAPRIRWKGRTH